MADQRENLLQDVQHKAEELQAQLTHFQQNSDSYSEEALLALQQSLNRFLYPPKPEQRRPSHALFQSDSETARYFRMNRERAREGLKNFNTGLLAKSQINNSFRSSPPICNRRLCKLGNGDLLL